MKWALIVWFALSAAASVAMIGKTRKPITHGQAAFAVVLDIALAVWVAVTW